MGTMTKSGTTQPAYPRTLPRRLGLLDATTIVAGSMIGSGIFITSADISRQVRSGSLLVLVWVFTALVTVAGAWSYGKLAMAFPRAGGQYVYLREAWGDLGGFLFGWAMLLVIQTGTIAAVAVAFAKYLGVLVPAVSSKHVFFKARFLSVTPLEIVAIALIVLLTWWNTTSVENGARLQNVFTTAKVLSLVGLLAVCFTAGSGLATTNWAFPAAADLKMPLIWAFAVATVGSLFSADAWNNVTFLGEEVRDAERNVPRALVYGTGLVTTLYVLANIGYLNALPLSGIASAPEDRVATAAIGAVTGSAESGTPALIMAVVILVSTFGCLNGLVLSGSRVLYAMSRDGLFLKSLAKVAPKSMIPVNALGAQALWASLLCLSGKYNDLLDYVIATVLIFYIATIAGRWKLARTNPALAPKTLMDRVVPVLYVIATLYVTVALALYKPTFTVPGLVIVALGIPAFYFFKSRQAPAPPA
ncbi:MAG TPA: amino acid permease [Thermoanaerobaculia bacterium]|nr:amino acid permease [Thermoanaerobaculia bacterium]